MKRFLLFFLFALFLASPVCSESVLAADQPPESLDVYSTITGRVTIDGKTPMANGVVLLFSQAMGAPPNPYRYWRIPDLITPLDSVGRFLVEVPEGTYYLMVAQKSPDREIGPPSDKEYLYFHGDKKGNPKPILVGPGAKVDLGSLKAGIWTPGMIVRGKGITAAEGIVADLEGKPVENAVVLAYLNPEAVGRPAYVSDRSDRKGRYLLRVHDGGTYYLKVRSVIGGGTPEPGEYLNTTNEFEPLAVDLVKEKIVKGVNLKVKMFEGKGTAGPSPQDKTWKRVEGLQSK